MGIFITAEAKTMKNNQPVTQREIPYPTGKYLVSKTDLKGIITYANDTFVELSGFSREELIGKNHNVVRHPDMPPAAFKDLWDTIKSGLPWKGVVKNRAKSGDHYWVKAFVVPIREREQTVGYMSVRSAPTRAEISSAEALYDQINRGKVSLGGRTLQQRLTIRARLLAVLGFMALLILLGSVIGVGGMSVSNRSLASAYADHLKPAVAIARMVERMADNRAQIMLALQHSPGNPYNKMHDHPVDVHVEATLKNREIIESLRVIYEKAEKTPDEEALAKAFFAARDEFSTEGVGAARTALKAGDYDQAQVLLLKRINPLYQEVAKTSEALQAYLAKQGDAANLAATDRYNWILILAIGGTLFALLLVVVAGFFLMRSIMGPLQQITRHFDHIAQGDLTDEIDISGRDEAGRVLTALAAMQVHLKVILDQINTASTAIESRSHQVQTQTTGVLDQSEQQRDMAQAVASAAEEFSQSVKEVAHSAESVSTTTNTAQQEVGKAQGSMDHSMEATHRVVSAVQESSNTIAELDRAIAKIGVITQVIREIADQTNLLALNAAIEAARAGEQGRGFAVVADEVRKLAERTSSSTTDIAATVAEIRSVTDSAVVSMERAVKEVDQGNAMIRESGEGLSKVTEVSREVAEMARHIAEAAHEQVIASEQVTNNIERIATLIDGNVAASQETDLAVRDLLSTAGELRVTVSSFRLVK
jgi:PAS domain S-box-containing protein